VHLRQRATAEDDAAPALDVRRVVEALDRQGVEYLMVGGVATRFHGAERLTKDIDLVPSSDADNLDRLAASLRDLGAFLRVGGMSDDEARALPLVLDGAALARMEISTWRTEAGDLDVLRDLRSADGSRLGFSALSPRSTATTLGGVHIRLASLGDIVASKRFADRDKDREALPELERLLRDAGA
jgi:hypothetical protein